jgi:hypothetical protein
VTGANEHLLLVTGCGRGGTKYISLCSDGSTSA